MPTYGREPDELTVGKVVRYILLGILGIIIIIGIFSTFYIVGAGERAIVLTWGNPNMNPQGPGLHVKIPYAQTVEKMNVQTLKYDADASAASKDLQVVSTKIAVNYHLTPETIPQLFKDIGHAYEAKIIQPAVQEVVKACTAKFTAEELITNRESVKECIDDALKARLIDRGINMETTSITNFDFSAEFNAAIEQKVTAEQNALTQKNKLAQIEYEAKQVVAAANGTATATVLQAQADAKRVELIQQQLANSPQYIQFVIANKWNGQVPLISMGGGIPVIQLPNGILNQPVENATS